MALTQMKAADLDEKSLREKGTVLVDFWAVWCGPCRMIAPYVEQLAEEYEGKLTVGKVNVDEEGEAAMRLGIDSIPTLILFKDGKEAGRMVGAVPYAALKAFVDRKE